MSKSYKLIREYPGSPKLETEVQIINGFYGTGFSSSNIPMSHVENNSEFWQEIIEKEYEILSFKIPGNDHWFATLEKNGMYGGWSEKHALSELNRGNWKIQSVKRLSDGEVFTVGDKVQTSMSLTINGFIIIDNELLIDPFEIIGTVALNGITKAKQPLFTTQDGVEIFEGNEFYFVPKHQFIIHWSKAYHKGYGNKIDVKYFSTKEKAEEYIIMNKPCLSINDVRQNFNWHSNSANLSSENTVKSLKLFIKQKVGL